MSFWSLSTGQQAASVTSAEMGGGDMEPIPNGTLLRCIITEAKYDDTPNDGRVIKLRWDVIDGEYKKRVVFQKVHVFSADAKKKDKAINMLAAIDTNAGGALMKLGREPSDFDLATNLTNKPMTIRVRIWETEDKTKKGNWVDAVQGLNAPQAQQKNNIGF